MSLPSGAVPWLLALLVAVIYLPALPASFQFDDWQVVLGDPRVRSPAAWWESMPGMRALVKLTYALNHTWADSVAAFRAINILLHALNSALVFLFVQRLASRLLTAEGVGAQLVAVIVALVFGLHPVQTESVTYIAARPNLLATCLCLLTMLAWLTGRERNAALWFPVVALCFVAALAGKETAAMLPLAMLLCLAAEPAATRRDVALPLALCALFAVLVALVWSWFPYDYLLRTSLDTRGPLQNLAAQIDGVSWLTAQMWRWDQLNADPMLLPAASLTLPKVLRGLALIAVLATGVWCLRRNAALGFGILWYFLWLAPTNSLLARLDLANDRQLYFALLGPAWCLGHAAVKAGLLQRPRAVSPTLVVLTVALALGTLVRNRVYTTEVSFWTDVVSKSAHNMRGWNNLGMAQAMACNKVAASDAFTQAIQRDPQDFRAQVNLALLQQDQLPGVAERCR